MKRLAVMVVFVPLAGWIAFLLAMTVYWDVVNEFEAEGVL